MLLAAIGIFLAPLLACTPASASHADDAPQPLPVEVLTVESQDSRSTTREFAGQVFARRQSRLSFELAGRVDQVLVDDGDSITSGDLLATLNTDALAAERSELVAQAAAAQARLDEMIAGPRKEDIAEAAARVREAEARLAIARRDEDRIERLVSGNVATEEELADARSEAAAVKARLDAVREVLAELRAGTRPEQIAAQQATVAQLQATIDRIDVSLGKSRLTAPFAGAVARRFIDEGAVVAAGQPVIELVEHAALEARIGIPADLVDQLEVNEHYPIRIGQTRCAGEFTRLLPTLDGTTRTRMAVFDLPADLAERVAPGQVSRLELTETRNERGIWLPIDALVRSHHGLWSAFAVVADDGQYHVERRDVEVLFVETDRAYVRGLLTDGDRIVNHGVHRIVPGQRVRLLNNADSSATNGNATEARGEGS